LEERAEGGAVATICPTMEVIAAEVMSEGEYANRLSLSRALGVENICIIYDCSEYSVCMTFVSHFVEWVCVGFAFCQK
jgi:hypothetical protein